MILITGATGFLGSHLAARLIEKGEHPVLLKRADSMVPALLENYSDRFEWRVADILDIFALEQALEGITHIYHCAAMVSFDQADNKRMMKANVEGTANLINLSLQAKVRRFLYVSSVAAIGDGLKGKPSDENSIWEKNDHTSVYGWSKFEAEREVSRGGVEGLEVNIVNPSIILGEENWSHGSGLMFKVVKDGIKFYPPGSSGMVWVEDVVSCMMKIMESELKAEKFILSSSNMSYREFFARVAECLGKKPPSIALKPWMLNIGWRLSSLLGIKGLNRDTAIAANLHSSYDASKACSMLEFYFKPINQVIELICKDEFARIKVCQDKNE